MTSIPEPKLPLEARELLLAVIEMTSTEPSADFLPGAAGSGTGA